MVFSKIGKKGASLISALIVMVFVTLTVAAISYIFLQSLKTEHSIATYKTSKEAAEAVGIYLASTGNFAVENATGCHYENCISGNCEECNCPIRLPDELKSALAGYINVNATLIKNCTDNGQNIYTVKIEAVSTKTKARTNILMVVQD